MQLAVAVVAAAVAPAVRIVYEFTEPIQSFST